MATFLILAHRDLRQLMRLIESLSGHRLVVHVDRKSKTMRKELDLLRFPPNVHILDKRQSINVKWGGFTQVKAMLLLIQEALPNMESNEKLVFLSGSDMLVRSPTILSDTLEKNPNCEFLRYYPLDGRKKDRRRWQNYHRWDYRLFKKRAGLPHKFNTVALRICGIVETFVRGKKSQPEFELYAGSNWFAISKECAMEMLRLRTNYYDSFFKSMYAPDEVYFATLFSLSSFSKSNIDKGSMRFYDNRSRVWQARNLTYVDESLNTWLTVKDFDSIRESGFLFARKFDSELSEELITELQKS